MTTLIIDIESDNLMPMASVIWVVCTRVIETGEERSFRERDDFITYVQNLRPTIIVGHHHIGFDLPCLQKVWGCDYTVGRQDTFLGMPVELRDTLLLSQYLNADRLNGHSLKVLGKAVGEYKGEHSDWSKWSEEMEAYCRQDVRATEAVYKMLLREIDDY